MGRYVLTSKEVIHFPFKLFISLLDKTGSHEQLMVEGSIVMDESAIISATRIQNNGIDVIPVGYIMKFLDEENWWVTSNQLSTEQSNEIWVCAFVCIKLRYIT